MRAKETDEPGVSGETGETAEIDGTPGESGERSLAWAGSVRARLGLALVLMAVRFVAPADPTRLAWLAGYAAAGAATGLVLSAAIDPGPRRWWRPLAVVGAVAFQIGLVLGWSEPMDVTAAGPSAPAVLCAAGALVVALALRLTPGGDGTGWPAAAASGAIAGYGLLLVGGARLLDFDVTEHVSAGAAVDGRLADVAPLAIVTIAATLVALGALTTARSRPHPGRATAALVGVAAVPLAAAGDGWSALVLVATAVLAGVVARFRSGPAAGAMISFIVLGGAGLAGAATRGAGPLALLGAGLYGALVGLLAPGFGANRSSLAIHSPLA
jgi:hypothetical protein